eukprot:574608-Rhodomonas_salina.1
MSSMFARTKSLQIVVDPSHSPFIPCSSRLSFSTFSTLVSSLNRSSLVRVHLHSVLRRSETISQAHAPSFLTVPVHEIPAPSLHLPCTPLQQEHSSSTLHNNCPSPARFFPLLNSSGLSLTLLLPVQLLHTSLLTAACVSTHPHGTEGWQAKR